MWTRCFSSSCHSCVHAVFFQLSGENVAFVLCRKSESSSELFLHTILQTRRKKLFVCFYRSSVSDAAFSSDSSDLYDFHLSFVFPCFHPPNTCFLSASSHFSPLLSLIFSISAPESASFSPRHVLPLTKPLVMLQRKSRLFSWNLQSDIFFCFSIWFILSSLRGAFILKSRFNILIHFFQTPSETHLQHPEPASVTSPGSTWSREVESSVIHKSAHWFTHWFIDLFDWPIGCSSLHSVHRTVLVFVIICSWL